jgi:AraC-like DNA-binding protein
MPAPAPVAPTVFSTAGLPDARRVELWETHNANALIGLDVHATQPLHATELNFQLPLAQLARVSGSAHVVERTAHVISGNPADAIAVYLTLRGDAWFRHGDGVHALRPGDALICETDRPFARGFPRGLDELVVKVPRAALAARGDVPRLRAPVIGRFAAAGGHTRDQYAHALARITSRAARTATCVPVDEDTVLDLVAALGGGHAAAGAAAHRAAARSYIDEHLTNPALGAAQVAAATGVSERQLSRIFAADGTSIPRPILSRRLQLAWSILSSPTPASPTPASPTPASPIAASEEGTGETVADVAARCGFTSVTYFSRVFRSHFGLRASDVRRAGKIINSKCSENVSSLQQRSALTAQRHVGIICPAAQFSRLQPSPQTP